MVEDFLGDLFVSINLFREKKFDGTTGHEIRDSGLGTTRRYGGGDTMMVRIRKTICKACRCRWFADDARDKVAKE
ncbi:hypothetical protein HZH66_014893 [Vespula vulgaris]|uniref:Uncharacterized protein n=1 Tax=Vespula vulgaris TaxID=7454 RepID=A0A834J0F1_VESVU|nr:hypothetical protein HZH66_014893 [Vespula vulgaris]